MIFAETRAEMFNWVLAVTAPGAVTIRVSSPSSAGSTSTSGPSAA